MCLFLPSPQSDLDGASGRRQVTAEEVAAWCREYNVTSFIETSAKQAVNITEAFTLGVRQWRALDRISHRELLDHSDTIDLMQRPISIGASGNGGSQSSCCLTGGGGGSANGTPVRQRGSDRRENL